MSVPPIVVDWTLAKDPQKIDQTSDFRSGQTPTAEEINSYINLLITQGDYNTSWLMLIAANMPDLVNKINMTMAELEVEYNEALLKVQLDYNQALVAYLENITIQYGAQSEKLLAIQTQIETDGNKFLQDIAKATVAAEIAISGMETSVLADINTAKVNATAAIDSASQYAQTMMGDTTNRLLESLESKTNNSLATIESARVQAIADLRQIIAETDYSGIVTRVGVVENDLAMTMQDLGNLSNAYDRTVEFVNEIDSMTKNIIRAVGAPDGIAPLGPDAKIPAVNLPAYVDDVLEFPSTAEFPFPGSSGVLYLSLAENKTYRWGGTTYVGIGGGVAIGETAETAFAGDRGVRLELSTIRIGPAGGVVNTPTPTNADMLGNQFPAYYAKQSDLELLVNYSTSEKVIGKWIDGKPLYRKTIDCGAMPNTTNKTVLHNISNIKVVHKISGTAYAADGTSFPLPMASNTPAECIRIYTTSTGISIGAGYNASNLIQSSITLEYTKTTD